jgi:hypothetical protein
MRAFGVFKPATNGVEFVDRQFVLAPCSDAVRSVVGLAHDLLHSSQRGPSVAGAAQWRSALAATVTLVTCRNFGFEKNGSRFEVIDCDERHSGVGRLHVIFVRVLLKPRTDL